MKGHTEQCVERNCESAQKPASQLQQVATLCTDEHDHLQKDFEVVGELTSVLRPDRFNMLIRWAELGEERLAILISYIHVTADYMPYCHVGDKVTDCKTGFISLIYFKWSVMNVR